MISFGRGLGGVGMVVDIFNTDKKYSVIYADPPWEYKQKARGCAENHYDVMSVDNICKLPIQKIKTDKTLLFLWTTFPQIAEALRVIESWGFQYKTAGFVWIKKNKKNGENFFGMGAYTRANAEICLLAISKKTKASEVIKSRKISQIIESPIEHHSKKPDIVRNKIVELLGDVSRIELFARQVVDGWDCWGNEV